MSLGPEARAIIEREREENRRIAFDQARDVRNLLDDLVGMEDTITPAALDGYIGMVLSKLNYASSCATISLHQQRVLVSDGEPL